MNGSDRLRLPRLASILVAATLALAGLALRSDANDPPRSSNPHGVFKEECAHCHTADSWKITRLSSGFDHARYGFPLAGAHASAACTGCHQSLDFTQARTQCVSCHQDPHRGEMGNECARCHGSRSFVDRGPMVRMHQLTRFPLSGSHAALDCESCHKGTRSGQMQFVGTQADCKACHMALYPATRTPDHAAGGFPHECQTCHGTLAWTPARFNHDASGFPLTGSHRATACIECHANGRYHGTPRECVSCHQADYDRATPPHPASGFTAGACASCHSTTAWSPATFSHSNTSFPLTGAHVATACAGCHSDGVYDGKPTACQSCHMTDYNTASPNHATAGFSASACATCHNTTQWAGATFNHDGSFFPIYSGRHNGRWSACQDCHTNASNYAVFTCLSCHPHSDKNKTDGDHSGRSGYSYDSAACYRCHPRGNS